MLGMPAVRGRMKCDSSGAPRLDVESTSDVHRLNNNDLSGFSFDIGRSRTLRVHKTSTNLEGEDEPASEPPAQELPLRRGRPPMERYSI